jgi:hypothetical protein
VVSKLAQINEGIALLAMGKHFALLQVMAPLILVRLHTVDANVVFRIGLTFEHADIARFFLFPRCLFLG